jgi:hypothetical protein
MYNYILLSLLLLSFQQNFKESKYKSNRNNQTLFVIERNKNNNIIYYDANLTSAEKINKDTPIDVYYIHFATDGKRAELSLIERKLAYGYSFEMTNNNTFQITLKAYKDRKISLFQDKNHKVYAKIKINGIDAYLKKLYVFAKPNLYTSVLYIEIYGEDIKTKSLLYEKIVNN